MRSISKPSNFPFALVKLHGEKDDSVAKRMLSCEYAGEANEIATDVRRNTV
ncbi:hypothetical protein GCM10023078_02320 [Gibbsiella greigii]